MISARSDVFFIAKPMTKEFWEMVAVVARVACLIFGLFPIWLIIGQVHTGVVIVGFTLWVTRKKCGSSAEMSQSAVMDVAFVVASLCCLIMALAWLLPVIGKQHASVIVAGFMAWLTLRQPITAEG